MIRVATTFRDREALEQSQRGVPEDVLFVPDVATASVGSAMSVQIEAQGLPGGLFVEGVVAWRRLQHMPGMPRGTGLRVLSSHVDRLTFLRRWAHGDVGTSGREHLRFPCSEKVLVSFAGARRATQRFVHGTLEDVSERGALLVTLSPVTGASDLVLDLSSIGRGVVSARVVWSHGTRIGLARVLGSRDEDASWAALVSKASRSIEPETRVAS